jgi:16S rRNA (cytosine967-C5)-methyltransferase
MKYHSHLNTAVSIIQQYDGREPLHHFLKNYFGQHKKYGSKDRKRISHLCYVFYRVASMVLKYQEKVIEKEEIEYSILCGLFLCSEEPDELLQALKPSLNADISLPVNEKIRVLNLDRDFSRPVEIKYLFPYTNQLSNGIDETLFALSHVKQPDLFLRIRPGYSEAVVKKLQNKKTDYEFIAPHTIRLPNGYRVDDFLDIDREIVIQDMSSQRVGEFLQFYDHKNHSQRSPYHFSVWDCCAASGGKSIMAKDILGDLELTVSDIRESILVNLKKRFAIAGINNYKSFAADLSTTSPSTLNQGKRQIGKHDLILADLPCTGSGTWGRTPEQLYFFQRSSIDKYSQLQKRIIGNIIPHLKQTGKLLYVTCSVFRNENEDIIQFIQENFPLKLEKMKVLKGYELNADTMFAALLSRLQ